MCQFICKQDDENSSKKKIQKTPSCPDCLIFTCFQSALILFASPCDATFNSQASTVRQDQLSAHGIACPHLDFTV